MIRTLAAAGGLSLAALAPIGPAGSAAAQTWGQSVYVRPYGGAIGGTPLSEVETRSYVAAGRWADGYADQPRVHVSTPGYGARYGYGYGYGYGHGRVDRDYGHGRYARRPHPGYRDAWGYDDDRPASSHGWSRERRSGRDCGCGDVYLYDR